MQLLTVEDIAARTQLHPVTVRKLLQTGRFGAPLKIGSAWRLREADLERALSTFAYTPRASRAARRAGLVASEEARAALAPRGRRREK